MAYCENLESRRLLSAGGFGAGHRAGGPEAGAKDAFTIDFGLVNGRRQSGFASAPDGTQFQFSISGNGIGQAVVDGAGFALSISGTDAQSSLNVFTDTFGLITSLTVDGSLRSINALDCSIGGDVSIAGTLGSASLFAVSSEAGNTIHFDIAGADVATSLAIQLVSDVTLTAASPIRSLRVRRWADLNAEPDVINAPSIGQLRTLAGRSVTGSFEADLNLSAPGGTSLGQMNVAGGLNGAIVHAAGNIGKVTLGAMHDSALLAGVNDAVAGLPGTASDFASNQSIAAITVLNGSTATFSDSLIAASSIGKIRVGKVGTNAVTPSTFGVAALNVNDYRRMPGGKPIVRKNLTQPGVFDSDDAYVAQILA